MNILLDCNNTIENHFALSQAKPEIMKRMSSFVSEKLSVNCSVKDIKQIELLLQNHNSAMAWINHVFFWRELISKFGIYTEDVLEEVYDKFLEIYREKVEIYEDFYEFIEWASINDYPVSLIANANDKRLRAFLAKFNLDEHFRHILISGEMPFKKPDKFMFLYPTKDLGYRCDESIMIGDRFTNDIFGAKRLGIHSVLINRETSLSHSPSPNYAPDIMVSSLIEASGYISSVKSGDVNRLYINKELISSSSTSKVRTAMVLAGGRGSRMAPLTKSTQKCLLPVNGKPILFHIFQLLRNSGVEKVVVALDYMAEKIRNTVIEAGNKMDLEVVCVSDEFRSTSHAVHTCLKELDDIFFYCHGNILFQDRLLEKLWEISHEGQFSTLALTPHAEDVTHLKVEEFVDSNIVKAGFASDLDSAELTHIGVSIYRKDLFEKHYVPERMTEASIVSFLSDGGVVRGYLYDKGWSHLETTKDHEEVQHHPYWKFAR